MMKFLWTAVLMSCCLNAVADDFLVRPLSEAEKNGLIDSGFYSRGCPVPLERLAAVQFDYYGFDGNKHVGAIAVLDATADDVVAVFREMYSYHFAVSEPRIVVSSGDKAKTGYTVAFNCRPITAGNIWSLHSFGTAIDINPVANPYLGFYRLSDRGYALAGVIAKVDNVAGFDRGTHYDPYKEDRPGLLESYSHDFAVHGWSVWGGNWVHPVDYMIVEIPRWVSAMMTIMTPADAKSFFNLYKGHTSQMSMFDDSSFGIAYYLYPSSFVEFFTQALSRYGSDQRKVLWYVYYSALQMYADSMSSGLRSGTKGHIDSDYIRQLFGSKSAE